MAKIRFPGPFPKEDGFINGDTLNDICKKAQRSVPIAGDGLLERETPDGTEMRIDYSKVARAFIHPWKIVVTSEGCLIQYATVGDVIPSVDGNSMSVNITENLLPIAAPENAGNVQLELTVDDSDYAEGNVTAAELQWFEGDAGDKDTDTATNKYYIIGRIDGGIAANAYTHSVSWWRAGGPGSPYILWGK